MADIIDMLRDRDAIVIGGLFHAIPVMREAASEIEQLRAALLGMVNMYVELVDSGDAGFWDAEKVPEVIAARAALPPVDRSDAKKTGASQ